MWLPSSDVASSSSVHTMPFQIGLRPYSPYRSSLPDEEVDDEATKDGTDDPGLVKGPPTGRLSSKSPISTTHFSNSLRLTISLLPGSKGTPLHHKHPSQVHCSFGFHLSLGSC